MKNTMLLLGALTYLAACGREPVATASAPPLREPTHPEFVGKVWMATNPGQPLGTMIIFMPDRTLVRDSCFETYRLSKWGVAGERIRWLEDTIPIEADVEMPNKNQLVLRVAGQDEEQSYVAASPPYVCPDMPK